VSTLEENLFAKIGNKDANSLVTTAHDMTTTMTLTMSQAPGVHACPNCGIGLPDHTDLASDAQKRIEDLEAQVRLLTAKATAAGLSLQSVQSASTANKYSRQVGGLRRRDPTA
jgi:hypothetical protein